MTILFQRSEGSCHNSKPVKVGKPSKGGGGGLGFYLGFPSLEVGKLFLLGGGSQKAQDDELFFKLPLIWAIEDQNNESYRGGWTFKKRRKIPTF